MTCAIGLLPTNSQLYRAFLAAIYAVSDLLAFDYSFTANFAWHHVASVDLVIECIPAYVYKTGIKLHFHLQVHSYNFSSQTFLSYCYRNGCI